ncbi:uncharacterized protein THITE_2092348 [Thermothielavioides terrestris NRRL 8126]|uniref:Uncharacterized protein n=1 Tax=Thermothielavioides terrestris (strain ATCC 38088 / NRRL 8126) TaxID=578455 RepID=G2RDV8_THETT|nr:uncharacterized protein THITE_2092348 [Thermothielavioides terrestris NRRL 8126]AEO70841.1 hypothetical protein THITE_2092348 [Thermothielavioides terrestris NRRL 8126]
MATAVQGGPPPEDDRARFFLNELVSFFYIETGKNRALVEPLMKLLADRLREAQENTSWAVFLFKVSQSWHAHLNRPFGHELPCDRTPVVDCAAVRDILRKPTPVILPVRLRAFPAFQRFAISQIRRYKPAKNKEPAVAPEQQAGGGAVMPREDEPVAASSGQKPTTLQQQIDQEWAVLMAGPNRHGLGAWEVPVPAGLDSRDFLFNPAATSEHFEGLDIFHNPITDTIRPILRLPARVVQPRPERPTRLFARFMRVNETLWAWADEIKGEQGIIPLEEWLEKRAEIQLGRQKQLMIERYENWDGRSDFGSARGQLAATGADSPGAEAEGREAKRRRTE